MIYVGYLIAAAIIVFLSNKASEYVDLLDQKTKLSGAFIGGVLLSAVTSLPELFTSISSTVMLDKPGLCIGNILGSDLFNLATLAVMILIFYRAFQYADVAVSHTKVSVAVFAMYGVVLLNMYRVLDFEVLTISITSIIIVVLYIFGVKSMSAENGESSEAVCESALTLRQIVIRFIAASVGLVAFSIVITYLTDGIAERLHLGNGLAGAIFLGVATSLPELSSTVALFRRKNYNIAIGNIIGSNLFNFIILAIVDVIYVGGGLYDFSDPSTVNLLLFGLISTPIMMVLLRGKNKLTQLVCPIGCLLCYFGFLMA